MVVRTARHRRCVVDEREKGPDMLTVRVDELDGAPMWSCLQGTVLRGDFLAWRRLGIGHTCESWLVWSVSLWSPAVLKMPRPHETDHPRARRTLVREATALCGNPHPALPRLYTDATGEPTPYIATEYIDGPTLAEEIQAGGPLAEAEVGLLGAQLLTGLHALHQRGIAHLDVRPANVVLRDMRPVLTEFGSARRIGTPRPNGVPVDATADLHALGATLRDASTGPFTGTPLSALVEALLDPDPTRRPTTAQALTTLAATVPDDLRPWPTWADDAAGRAS
jgi:tRNA A-37 threonylcarbamoyl transferase component Bud32